MPTNRPIIMALTGTIGSGKSAVADYLARRGAAIIDSDLLARQAVAKGSAPLASIFRAFSGQVVTPHGELDRKALAQIVFSDPQKRHELEAILHPEIRKLAQQQIAKLLAQSPLPRLIAQVIPLFFESKLSYPEVEKVVVVAAPAEACISRVMARDGCSREDAERRLAAQMPIEEKIKRAHIVIQNNADLAELHSATESALAAYL